MTVHNYLKFGDHYLYLSTFFCIAAVFSKQIILIIDEGHLYTSNIIIRIPLNETWSLVKNAWVFYSNHAVANKMKRDEDVKSTSFQKRDNNFVTTRLDGNKLQYLISNSTNQTVEKYSEFFSLFKTINVFSF